MRKVDMSVPSRAGVVGELNNLPDAAAFSPSSEYIRLAAFSSDAGEEILSSSKDLTRHYDLEGGMFTKGWMVENGYLHAPRGDFGQPAGLEIFDEGLLNVAVGGSVSGVIDTTGDTDDIRVFLVAGQTYHVSLRGTGPNALHDTFLQVFNPSAALVNFDDDGGNDLFSMMTFTASATGNYTIRAASFSNPGDPGIGGYTVDVRVQGADAVGDTNATAVHIEVGSTTFGFRETATVSGGADLDRYEINLEAGKYYTFKLAAGADYNTDYTAVPAGEIDTILRLRNAAGALVAQNDDNAFPDDISSGIGFLAETTGTYYLDVTGYSGQTGGYVLETQTIDYTALDPLDAIRWKSADNIDTVDVNGTPTATIYFGLAGENFGRSDFGSSYGWTAKEKAAVMSALQEFTKITGITYVETLDQANAEFRVNTVEAADPVNAPLPYGAYFFPQDPVYGGQQGVGMFNINNAGWDKPGESTQDIPGNQVSLDKGGFNYAVILHEFGHAHGLAHTHDNGGGSDVLLGVTGSTGSYGIFNLNQGVYTVMSYNDAWDFHPDGPSPLFIQTVGFGWSGTLSAFDIAALQERYGVHAYNTGDNVYTLKSVNATGTYYETIWDTGGNDTIAYSSTGNARIDLTAATLDYSPTGAGVLSFVDQVPGTAGADGIFGGFTIANGVVIENATSGSGNDVLIGNDVDNRLTGGGGNDILMGRLGYDTAVFAATKGGSAVVRSLDGSITVNGAAGSDSLTGIERLEFSDGSMKFAFRDASQWTSATSTDWNVGDFNGDGKDDIFRVQSDVDMHLSTGTAFSAAGSWSSASTGTDGRWYVGDYNGDGKDDIFRYVAGTSGANVHLSSGTAFTDSGSWTGAGYGSDGRWNVGDFNGDGKDDIFRYIAGSSGAEVFLSNGSAFVAAGSWTGAGNGSDNRWYIGDFNGDGKDDILRYVTGSSGADVFLSNGTGFVAAGSWTGYGYGSDNQWYVDDFNGDGKDDLLRYIDGSSGGQVLLSTGTAFNFDGNWTATGFGSQSGWDIGDFNGDSTADLLRVFPTSTEVLI